MRLARLDQQPVPLLRRRLPSVLERKYQLPRVCRETPDDFGPTMSEHPRRGGLVRCRELSLVGVVGSLEDLLDERVRGNLG